MKAILLAVALACGMTATAQAAAPPAAPASADPNMIGLTTENGRAAFDFIDLWFNQHKPLEAFDKYVSRDHYLNHTATTDDDQSFESQRAFEASITPADAIFEMKQVVAQGDLVVLDIFARGGGKKATRNGDELVEFMRFRDHKIVDHWDFHVPIEDKSVVFSGMNR